MCDVVSRVTNDPSLPEANRRQFLKVLSAAAAGGVVAAGARPAFAQPRPGPAPDHRRRGRTRLLLLGTAGGPALLDGQHAGISTAVVHRDRVYIVDLGLGSLLRLRQSSVAGEPGANSTLDRVRGIFFTHMHSDHLTDWPALYATGVTNRTNRSGPKIEVFGPGDRGTLPQVNPPGRPTPELANPGSPTPGISAMTGYLKQAFASDLNDRALDSNTPLPESLFHVQDIDLSGRWDIDPAGKPPRLSAPIPVWTDGEVTVTATLVDHHPTAPAFGFRFDTPDGSVTISGDTTVSENLIDLAKGTDYLVHEVIDPKFIDDLVATLPPAIGEALRTHLLESHTTIRQVGQVAERAGAKNLVLTHLGPASNPVSRWQRAQRGYSGRLIVGKDLMELRVG